MFLVFSLKLAAVNKPVKGVAGLKSIKEVNVGVAPSFLGTGLLKVWMNFV